MAANGRRTKVRFLLIRIKHHRLRAREFHTRNRDSRKGRPRGRPRGRLDRLQVLRDKFPGRSSKRDSLSRAWLGSATSAGTFHNSVATMATG
jgi:hypothetical protein